MSCPEGYYMGLNGKCVKIITPPAPNDLVQDEPDQETIGEEDKQDED